MYRVRIFTDEVQLEKYLNLYEIKKEKIVSISLGSYESVNFRPILLVYEE